ncbi:MAG: DUF423 domain-containing protein [Acidobacteria bacterium]|nr:DUF423 domain-containing protein [Acidobacteriota bacterium]
MSGSAGSRAGALGALFCALAVIAGAFGAHGLRGRLDAGHLALWETAARYLMYGGLGILAAAAGRWRHGAPAAGLMAAGGAIFSGTVFALALGGPRILGAVTPIGGVLLIAGFLTLAVGALRTR